MNRDPRVSPWAAQYVEPEEGDDAQPEMVNVTRPKRRNPSAQEFRNENPGVISPPSLRVYPKRHRWGQIVIETIVLGVYVSIAIALVWTAGSALLRALMR